ncbi:hypothetical protein NCS57_01490100 [Fusarium keratoplasticum]|uniref:Uncharacterized protein n=1 Tax=Fusarium keratoplasticum TaxID=1328300 RepID=A0ACC0QC48_9HYPO|nr:hypothetical protein NCS57_01490100 [Fusarium keratoplasticum]KAI8648222.1 hypothetical protein NCS57_01490100 [Fusarium keratoplasticum]KAI8649012.1 hypothetical protein NCS55_01474600 [Fusarium keratoplasticum]
MSRDTATSTSKRGLERSNHVDEPTEGQVINTQRMHDEPFTIWTAMGLGHSITNTAVGMIVGLGNALPFGGPPVLFWGFLAMAFSGLCIAVSLGELASAFPHSGGQYYWVGKLGPPSCRRFLSFMIGIVSWASGLCVTASVNLVVTQIILSMISMTHPSFEPEPWVTFVGYQIINLVAFGFNFFEHSLPWVSRSLLIFTPAMLFAVFVSCLAGDSHKQGAHMVLLNISNISGWPNGIAFLIGLNPSAWSFSCLDAITHLADEIPQPRKNIPKALLCTVALGFCTGLPIILAFAFSVQDLDAALSATVPSLEIFRQIYNSKAAAIALQSFVTASAFGAVIGCHTWQSRMAWSFSRDRGFPFHSYISRIARAPYDAPIWAHLWSNLWVVILGCLYLASKLAFNSLVAGGILFQYISYSASILCLLYSGRSKVTPGPFWFPVLGYFTNFFTLAWSLAALVFFCFPYYIPAVADEMNYVSAVLGVVGVYALVFWFAHGRNAFKLADPEMYD